MKKLFITGMLCCVAVLLSAQEHRAVFDTLEKYIREGNTTALSECFAGTVTCELPGEEGMYSKAQATMVVKRFFEKQVPKTFAFKHYSNDRQALQYAIGYLQTQGGDTLRVTVFVKNEEGDDAVKIQQLRIEKE